ncbi:MAG: DUF5696 domain-containing protein [bacterium]
MRFYFPIFASIILTFAQPLKLSEGMANLLETYPRWGYIIRGGKERYMPSYWFGRFEPTGADCYPQMKEKDLTPWFIHPPWRGTTGETFAEWELSLPEMKPIILRLKVELSKGALPASDGVLFKLIALGDGGKEIGSVFCRKEEWEERVFDISFLAGKQIKLRLVVNPGEKWDTTCDWARVGELKIIVGNEEMARMKKEREKEEKRKEIIRKYGENTGDVSKFWGKDAKSPKPSCQSPYQNYIEKISDGSYKFAYEGKDCHLEFLFSPPFSSLNNLRIFFNGKELEKPCFMGGVSLVLGGEVIDWGREDVKRKVEAKMTGKSVEEREIWEFKGERGELNIKASIEGKSMKLEFTSDKPVVNAINIAVPPFKKIFVPFLFEGQAEIAYVEPLFLSAFCDWWETEASSIGADGASPTYIPKTNGERNPAREIFYLTASPLLDEVLPNIPNPPSPYLKELSRRLVLDIWAGKFADDRNFLKELKRYRINSLLVIKHDWQRDGYDNAYPTTMPANKSLGGDEELRKLSEEAKRIGHRFCVHENYYDYYPNSEAFKYEDVALDPEGNYIKGWFNGAVPIQALILKPSKFLHYEKIFSPEIKRRYDVNAGYFDIMPNWNVDYDAKAEGAGKISYTHRVNIQAYDFLRKTYGGPVVCEASDFTEAGYYDGGSNYGVNRRQIPMLVDFELLKVHPLMLNHGMGYYERWLIDGYSDPSWYFRVPTEEERDEYRLMTMAFGRIGFLGHQLMFTIPGLVKEYFLTLPIQKRYGATMPRKILYEVEGKWVSSSGAALLGDMTRLCIEYENGLKLYLNRGKEDWKVGDKVIPQYGFLAQGADVMAYTARVNGVIADYSEDEEGIFCDARTQTYLPKLKRIFPSIAHFRDLGNGKFEITYKWVVEDEPEGDFVAFVHFMDKEKGQIAFQQDHNLPVPTKNWEKGMVIEDGPYTIEVPKDKEGSFPIYIGLYNKDGRLTLGNGRDSFMLGRLLIKRENGEVSLELKEERGEDLREKYLSRLNKEGKIVDFGKVETDGCLRIEKGRNSLRITTIPLGRECFVGLKLRYFKKRLGGVKVVAFGEDGREIGSVQFTMKGDLLTFRTGKGIWFYEVCF